MLLDAIREIAAATIRRLPPFRGLGRGLRFVNLLFHKLGAKPLVVAKMHDGTSMIVDLRTHSEVEAYYRGTYDSFFIYNLLSLFDHNSVFLDVGANIGFYTIAAANSIKKNKSDGFIFSFEPFQGNYNRIIDNLEINKLSTLCSVFNVGLSNDDREAQLTLREDFEHGSDTGNAAITTNEEFDKGFKKVTVRLKRLDDEWNNQKNEQARIDFVKLDIEGHEDYCLEGAVKTFNAHRPTILMEVNKPYYEARDVNIDNRIIPFIPREYSIYRPFKSVWVQIQSLYECNMIDNVLLIPNEKTTLENYKMFR